MDYPNIGGWPFQHAEGLFSLLKTLGGAAAVTGIPHAARKSLAEYRSNRWTGRKGRNHSAAVQLTLDDVLNASHGKPYGPKRAPRGYRGPRSKAPWMTRGKRVRYTKRRYRKKRTYRRRR